MNRNSLVIAAAVTTLAFGIGGGAALAGSSSTPVASVVTVGDAAIGSALLPTTAPTKSSSLRSASAKKRANADANGSVEAAGCGGTCPGYPAPTYPDYGNYPGYPSDPGNGGGCPGTGGGGGCPGSGPGNGGGGGCPGNGGGGGCPGYPAPTSDPRPEPTSTPTSTPTSNPTARPTSAPTDQPLPTEAPAPEPTSPKPSTPASSFVARVLELTNQERAKKGRKPLQASDCLNDGAQRWSNTMANTRRMVHQSLGWISSTCKFSGYAGENIAMGYPTPEAVMQGWINSPGHYANIMNENYTHLGVGYNPTGHYWTQNFAR